MRSLLLENDLCLRFESTTLRQQVFVVREVIALWAENRRIWP